MSKFKKSLKKYILPFSTIVFGFLVLQAFFVSPEDFSRNFSASFNLYRLAVMVIFIVLLLLSKSLFKPFKSLEFPFLKKIKLPKIRSDLFVSFKKSFAAAPRYMKVLSVVVPLAVLVFAIMQVLWPEFAIWLIRCDNKDECGINFRHGIFIKAAFQLIAAGTFATLLYKFAKKKRFLPTAVCAVLVLVLIVMIGEEISWGQRIFGWETPADYAVINKQGETNLHNLYTQIFQNVLYFGGWLLLVALPFFREQIAGFLAKFKKLAFLADFLPPAYFVLIFAAAWGLVDPLVSETGLRYSSILFTILGTVAILIYLVIGARGRLAEHISWTLGAFAIALFLNLLFTDVWDGMSGVPTEYHELFISFGIMLWAIWLRKNLKLQQ